MLLHLLLPALQCAPADFQAEMLKGWAPHLLRVAHPDSLPGSLPGLRRCPPRPGPQRSSEQQYATTSQRMHPLHTPNACKLKSSTAGCSVIT